MTAQRMERLLYNGVETVMEEYPLEPKVGSRNPDFIWSNTNCWRRYVGTWEMVDDKLFLVSIEARTERNGQAVDVTVSDLFPDQDRVLADWYTGQITIPHTDAEYLGMSMGESPIYNQEIVFQVERGRVIETKLRKVSARHFGDL